MEKGHIRPSLRSDDQGELEHGRPTYMLRIKQLAFRRCEVANCGVIFDFVVTRCMAEHADVVPSHDVGSVSLVANRKL